MTYLADLIPMNCKPAPIPYERDVNLKYREKLGVVWNSKASLLPQALVDSANVPAALVSQL